MIEIGVLEKLQDMVVEEYVTTVSYTHLDVYKRQVWKSLKKK